MTEKLWDEFFEIMSPFLNPVTFEEYMSNYEFEVSEADKKQLKQLYEEALAIDNKEDLEKAEEKWEAFYKVLDPYLTVNEEILISASKLTINDQVYVPQH